MQRATVVVSPRSGWFQSFRGAFVEESAIDPIAIHSINLVDDETGLFLYELAGDADDVRDILAADEDTTDWNVSEGPETTFAQILFEPSTTVRRIFELLRGHRVTIETPIHFTDNGGIRVSVIGPDAVLSSIFDGSGEATHVTIEAVGDYRPARRHPFSELSARQQEVLRLAVEMGYFAEPREATQAELAAALDCSRATVGSHLRRIEETLLPALVPEGTSDGAASADR
jgi:predicted DNA binding protein